MNELKIIKSMSQLHRLLGVEKPQHSVISLIHAKNINWTKKILNKKYAWDFYMITLKYHDSELHYGRNYYDFEEGSLLCTAPGQVFEIKSLPTKGTDDGWTLFFHKDLIRQSELGKKITKYSFFSYNIKEALHLSEDEKNTIYKCVTGIQKEYLQNIDKHSQAVIVSNLDLLLNHCNRFYDRQFYTRSNHNQDVVTKIEALLTNYFNSEKMVEKGILTVKYCAEHVNLSPNYLSDLLKKETGRNTQEHIHYHLIEKAKNRLLSSNDTISQISYDLGFEYPQYFGNLFKKKVGMSPNQYRKVS